jgi:hypothetical protein
MSDREPPDESVSTGSKNVSAFKVTVHRFKRKVSSSVTGATQSRGTAASNRVENRDNKSPGLGSNALELTANRLEVGESGLGLTLSGEDYHG